jgi:hypothetical protein
MATRGRNEEKMDHLSEQPRAISPMGGNPETTSHGLIVMAATIPPSNLKYTATIQSTLARDTADS